MKLYDVVIIGGGIIGANIAYELKNKQKKILLLEKNACFGDETTTGNSGVIHGGFDPEPHKIEAKLNVLGNEMWQKKIFPKVNFPRIKINSLVVAFNDKEDKEIQKLYERGLFNNLKKKDLKILTKAEVLNHEPMLNPAVTSGLLCTNSWVIDPIKATNALIEKAQVEGLKAQNNSEVVKIQFSNEAFLVTIKPNIIVKCQYIVNAAGHYADEIAAAAGYPDFKQTTRRGQYLILSMSEAFKVKNICFMVPTIHGKGVIVAPRLDGRVLVGPSAENNVPKADTRLVTQKMHDHIKKIAQKLNPHLNLERVENILAGSRPIDLATNDFVIKPAKQNFKFINAAGMQSPGLSSAPAIAKEVHKLLKNAGYC